MKVMYTKVNVDQECPSRFQARVMGHQACCSSMHAMTEAKLDDFDNYSGKLRGSISALQINVNNDKGNVSPRVEFNYRTAMPSTAQNVCMFCGEKHTAEEVPSNEKDENGFDLVSMTSPY